MHPGNLNADIGGVSRGEAEPLADGYYWVTVTTQVGKWPPEIAERYDAQWWVIGSDEPEAARDIRVLAPVPKPEAA